VLFYLAVTTTAARPLDLVERLMSDNNAVIIMIVLLLIRTKLVGDGGL
jgi:hypothetical protein